MKRINIDLSEQIGHEVLDYAFDLAVFVGLAVGDEVVEIAYFEGGVVFEPILFRGGERVARDAYGIVFAAEVYKVAGLLGGEHRLRLVELGKQIGAAFGDAQIIVGGAENANDVYVAGRVDGVVLSRENVDTVLLKSGVKPAVVGIFYDVGFDVVFL